jgi:hypothetical protein
MAGVRAHAAVTGDRKERLMQKLLSRVAAALHAHQVPLTADVMDQARAALEAQWNDHHGNLTERDLKSVVQRLRSGRRSQSVMDTPSLPQIRTGGEPKATTPPHAGEVDEDSQLQKVLHSTSRRQRQMMADADWIRAAEEDHRLAMENKLRDKENHLHAMMNQKNTLDNQMAERAAAKERERQEKERQQREMNEQIELHRQLTRREQQEAMEKALRERNFREAQQREVELARERQRVEEHNEQVRQYIRTQEELRQQREQELSAKKQSMEEWKRVISENQRKLAEKERQKEEMRESDRKYQEEYIQSQLKRERDREEAKRQREQRAEKFVKLAEGVAAMFAAKEQDQSSKIEAEYQKQLQRTLEDEQERKMRNKMRLQECLRVQTEQIESRKRKEAEEKDEARRFAEGLRRQAEELRKSEDAKKLVAKQEALRMKEFLGTQLQMSHYKETKPLETSITRPISVATTMFSPSRFEGTPKLKA